MALKGKLVGQSQYRIPYSNLDVQYKAIKNEVKAAFRQVLESQQFILGAEVAAFESEFAQFIGTRFGVGVNSGTSALHLALLAAGIGPGDEVITVPFTFAATVAAICYTGARPVLVDIDPVSLNIDVAKIEEAITCRTKAIIAVHLYGQPADMDSIRQISETRNLLVIEDAAQAHGAVYKGKKAGSIGDLSCFSFYPGKNLGACGEAGMVLTNEENYARLLRMLRDHGQEKKNQHAIRGYNYRMEALQASVLRIKLGYLEEWTRGRQENASLYEKLLDSARVEKPGLLDGVQHVYHVYAIRSRQRDGLRRHLSNHGVETGIHYPIPVHLQSGFQDLGYRSGDFPVAEACAPSVLSLPVYPELTRDQIEYIASLVNCFRN